MVCDYNETAFGRNGILSGKMKAAPCPQYGAEQRSEQKIESHQRKIP
jgi:hypothetical protein